MDVGQLRETWSWEYVWERSTIAATLHGVQTFMSSTQWITLQRGCTPNLKSGIFAIMSLCANEICSSSSSSSNLYFARVIPSIQTVLLSIGALEFKNLQYTFKNLL